MNIAFLGLGGNLGNRMVMLEKAVRELGKLAGVVLQRSGVFETEPWGTVSPNSYFNLVIRIGTNLSPEELLSTCLTIEKKLGRRRVKDQYADRPIDIDVLYYNDLCYSSATLQVPHPRIHLRKFVLGPLAQIAPDYKDPQRKEKISRLLKDCPDKSSLTFVSFLKPKVICIEGNIGSGKTTLSRHLAKTLHYDLVEEEFEKENLIRHYYEQPSIALSVEFNFLLQRFFQFEKIQKKQQAVLCDFSFYRSLWFSAVSLKKEEFRLFASQFQQLNNQLIQPDLVIHLSSPIQQLQKNIRKRGRIMEKNLSDSYLKKLDKSYQSSYLLPGIPLVTINIRRYDRDSEQRLARHVEKVLKENFAS